MGVLIVFSRTENQQPVFKVLAITENREPFFYRKGAK